VTGGLDCNAPPYAFTFYNCSTIQNGLKELAESVMDIAAESVNENGGSISRS
jgi:hypothetical protein